MATISRTECTQRLKGVYRLLIEADGLAAMEELEAGVIQRAPLKQNHVVKTDRTYGAMEVTPCGR